MAVAVARELKLPVLYLGVGEAADDLVDFQPESSPQRSLADPATESPPAARRCRLAARGRYRTAPNPRGAVLVRDGAVVGEGWHRASAGRTPRPRPSPPPASAPAAPRST